MDWLHPITIFFLITLIILLVLKMGHFWNYSSQITVLLPGPKPLPILGNLHIIDQERPHRTMLKLSKVYGPVFSIQMGFQKMVVLTGYEMVKEALVNQADAFAERPIIPMFEEFSNGFGLTLSHGKNWKVMQRFTLSTLRDYGMGKRSIEDKIVEECSILTKKLESYKGKPLETTTVMNAAVASIIVSILLGRRYEYEDPIFRRLLELINQNVRVFGSPSVLEKSNNINGYFHNENLKTLVANLFAAGMETTSTTLRWALLLMMKHPEIQCKVQEEIAVTIGSAQPRAEHRKKMPYTDAVIHEVQRYANIIPTNLPHATTKDITLKGYFIPKGSHIITLLSSVLHDDSQWKKPLRFYPEHFIDPEGNFIKRDAFMPFSAGRRQCAGETLAKMELFLFFTTLMQKFTFQPAPGTSREDLDLTPAVGFTTPPMPFDVCALPR
ncbi:cytochrome P450 2K4 isoform X1 [Anolis carolinensis]|uniref:cytochrome P450 2K4 isoform X1 n=1 Tax=Anolis carolinensis TaxID=28377 RepID=UPI002F2B8F51